MSFVVTRHRPTKTSTVEVPSREDGSPFEFGMIYSGHTRCVFFDDVEEGVAALVGDFDYVRWNEHDRLVARIRYAIGQQCALQAAFNHAAQVNGDWSRCTLAEKTVLSGPRFEQPRGWSNGLFGAVEHWTAPVPLVLVSTGYINSPMPVGPTDAIVWLDPLTSEDLLNSCEDARLVQTFMRAHE